MYSTKRTRVVTSLVSMLFIWGLIPVAAATTGGSAGNSQVSSSRDVAYQFSTNDYTMPEPSGVRVPVQPIPSSYHSVAQNQALTLYLDKASMGIMVKNRLTGYVWSSIPSKRELAHEQLNNDWQQSVTSPLLVTYFTSDDLQNTGSFASLGGQILGLRLLPDGFQAKLFMTEIQTTVTLAVRLDGNGLVVGVPASGVVEGGDNKLASLQVYPFLGAVHAGDIPGYMFIPDGSGALMRFTNTHPYYDGPYIGSIYGDDLAIQTTAGNDSAGASNTTPPQQIAMPVFGMVHGEGQNGFVAMVEKGQYNANIVAYPGGVNTNLYWISAQFVLRHPYFQPTSVNMGGFNTFESSRDNGDMQVRYVFLSGSAANYVGMAKTYQTYLKGKHWLSAPVKGGATVPLRIEILGAEMKPGLFGQHVVDVTSFDQAQRMIEDLAHRGIHNVLVVYRGWNAGGLTGQNPTMFSVESSLGGAVGLSRLQQYCRQHGIPLYLYSDFTEAYRSTGAFHIRLDGVRNIANQVIKQPALNPLETAHTRLANLFLYYMNPKVAERIAKTAADNWKQMGIKGVAVDHVGSILYSDHNPGRLSTRRQTAVVDEQMADLLKHTVGSVSLYAPNDYMFRFAREVFDVPMSSSQYMYETDAVPFLEIVLHGYTNYFAPVLNFDADPQDALLRMVDYGAYPSFYLTHDPSWELEGTPSLDVFTSRYADWAGAIQTNYSRVDGALRQVQNATLQSRTVPDWGIAEDEYSNGVKIIVNYRSTAVTVDHMHVRAREFMVEGSKF